MNRFYYYAGFAFIALCGVVVVREVVSRRSDPYVMVAPAPIPDPPAPTGTDAQRWFASMKPYCNPVEVEVRTRFTPPPSTTEGAGYHAACFGLAGKIDRAREIIDALDAGYRPTAANVVFEVAHPVADAGDDRASGPMMGLVIDYWPSNYMAMYHAGMSEYSLGQLDRASTHLQAFLRMYNAQDGFTSGARQALAAIEKSTSGLPKQVESPRP
jgi:hypothetical protein